MRRPALALAVSSLATLASAQPMVQSDFYEGAARVRGNRIIFCVWPSSPMVELDRAVGEQIASLQLLEAEFYDVSLVSTGTQELFEQELFVHLMDNCDAAMGTSHAWRPLPEWLTISEAYYDVTYVLASSQPDIRSPLDLPQDARIGSLMLSQADMTLAMALGTSNRPDLRRIPYDTPGNILRAIAGGQLDAGIIPNHALPLLSDQYADSGIEVAPLAFPVLEPEPVGIVLLSRDAYLRELLDEAISALRADGTIAELAANLGFSAQQR